MQLLVYNRGTVTFYTDQESVSLEDVPFEDGLLAGNRCRWRVETLGAVDRVEQLLNPPGVLANRKRSFTASRTQEFWILEPEP